MRAYLDKDLQKLDDETIRMISFCEVIMEMVKEDIIKGKCKDEEIKIIGSRIDLMEKKIEKHCLNLIMHQQPVAGDLRIILATLKMISDIERIGDQVENISSIIQRTSNEIDPYKCDILEMIEAVQTMLNRAITSWVHQDVELAKEVIESDDIIDEMFASMYKKMQSEIIDTNSHNGNILDVLMIAKYLERIADHSTNLAEKVEFAVLGTIRD